MEVKGREDSPVMKVDANAKTQADINRIEDRKRFWEIRSKATHGHYGILGYGYAAALKGN